MRLGSNRRAVLDHYSDSSGIIVGETPQSRNEGLDLILGVEDRERDPETVELVAGHWATIDAVPFGERRGNLANISPNHLDGGDPSRQSIVGRGLDREGGVVFEVTAEVPLEL